MASMATSSPMAVKTMTSVIVSISTISSYIRRLTGVLLILFEEFSDLIANFTVGDFDIVLGAAIVGHKREEAVIGDVKLARLLASNEERGDHLWTYKLVFLASDVGDLHVMGRRGEIFKLLAGENVKGDKMNLGMTVFTSL